MVRDSLFCYCQTADKNYKRLTSVQSVGLKHANLVISVDNVHKVDAVRNCILDVINSANQEKL